MAWRGMLVLVAAQPDMSEGATTSKGYENASRRAFKGFSALTE